MKKLAVILTILVTAACATRERTLFVGTYSDGFYAIDYPSGEVIGKAQMPNPSFMAINGSRIYAVSEMAGETASVWAWKYTGNGFEYINKRPSGIPGKCEDPCHAATDGHTLAVSNYSGGSLALFRIADTGAIGPMDSLIISSASGPDLSRQGQPHVHCAAFTPEGKHLLFSEFSADEIGALDIVGRISNYHTAASLPDGFGPRHLLFDNSGKHFYVIGELSGDIAAFNYDNGRLSPLQIIKADEADARGAADIHFSPDGKFLYASLRLVNDGISIFSVASDGTLTKIGYQHTGPHPRNFLVTDDEVFVACRDNDSVEIYSRNARTGLLSDTGRRISVPKPVFLAFR